MQAFSQFDLLTFLSRDRVKLSAIPRPDRDGAEKNWICEQGEAPWRAMSDCEIQCPACGETFFIPPLSPEEYGSQLDYDCEVC